LHQHLDGDAVGDLPVIDEEAAEIEIRLGGGRKADLDFLETHLDERVPHAKLALVAHGLDQRLVAVTQVDAAPDGGLCNLFLRPGAIRQLHWRVSSVLLFWGNHHLFGLSLGLALLRKTPESQGESPCRPSGAVKQKRRQRKVETGHKALVDDSEDIGNNLCAIYIVPA
jgi:hypothetical protein